MTAASLPRPTMPTLAPPTLAPPTGAPPTGAPDERVLPERVLSVPAMGGSLHLRVAHRPGAGEALAAGRDLERVAARVGRWAARLTRFSDTSDLAALNAREGSPGAGVRPTLAGVLDWAERATDLAPGLVDVTLLDERLAAETAAPDAALPPWTDRHPGRVRRWHLVRRSRGGTVVRREPCRFDLDGVAKGWIADRALDLLRGYPAALVDADGDIALRIGEGVAWDIGIADPRDPDGQDLALLGLDGTMAGTIGIATSGTSVHRWASAAGGPPRHHLIDPRTRRPAVTDVIQATVIAGSARAAEVLAKAAVIAGSDAAMGLLDRDGVGGAVLLLEGGGVITLPGTTTGWPP